MLVWSACAFAALASEHASASPERADELVYNALQLEPNVERGGLLFAEHCAQCHGSDAVGRATFGSPSLAGQRRAYTIKQLADFAELERKSDVMHRVVSRPPVAEPQAWADLAAYLNSLAPTSASKTGDGRQMALGKTIFLEQCASCHQEDGRGDDDGFVPSLRNQHYSYLLRQIRNITASHRTNIDEGMVRFLDELDKKESAAVADYLSRMRGPVRDRSEMNDDGVVDD
jgi:cytochrome c oxidase cbb3-type subunit 3